MQGFWVITIPGGGIGYWFPSTQENLILGRLPSSRAPRVIICCTRLTRFSQWTPNYTLASNLYCGKESNERLIIPLYINTHFWHINNSRVCFPNLNARRRISAVGMDRVCHDWCRSVDVPLHWDFYWAFPPWLPLSFPAETFDWHYFRLMHLCCSLKGCFSWFYAEASPVCVSV